MLSEELYTQVLDNFGQQHRLYLKMADWSRQQLDMLEQEDWTGEKLNQLLEERQVIINDIDGLSSENKRLQGEVITSLGLDEFVLSCLEDKLETEQYQELQEVLALLSQLLANISDMDHQSQLLIKQRIGSRKSTGKVENRLVQNAYRDAMQQGKKIGEF